MDQVKFVVVVRNVSYSAYVTYVWNYDTQRFVGEPEFEVVNGSTYENVDPDSPLGRQIAKATIKEVVKFEEGVVNADPSWE